jgi:hypothetical protein
MGLPLVGETLHFFTPDDDDSFDVPRFVRLRLVRYKRTTHFGLR